MKTILEVNNLSVAFTFSGKKVLAVQDLSYTLREGEVLAIVGESGSGKSVATKAILGLNPTENITIAGEILYKGTNLLSLSPSEWQKIRGKEIGIIFQDPGTSLNPTMKVGRQILESYTKHHKQTSKKKAQDKVYELLELVGIKEPKRRYDEYPHQLSGGLQQRVMIAMALAPSPRILIADEPTTALDVTTQAQILDLLRDLQKTFYMSIIFITHDLRLASSFSSEILVMYAGELMEQGQTTSLFTHPRHPYTQRLIASIPTLALNKNRALPLLSGSPLLAWQKTKGCPFHTRCPEATGLCQEERPPLTILSSEQKVSCWLHDPL